MTRREITESRIVRNILDHNDPADVSHFEDLFIASKHSPNPYESRSVFNSQNLGRAKTNTSLPRIVNPHGASASTSQQPKGRNANIV